MRCLFCGKELALLKRLRGAAEFCSEAHRKEYQEQYEQLAVARLLQARPPATSAGPIELPSALHPAETAAALDDAYVDNTFEPSLELEDVPEIVEDSQLEEDDPAPLAGFVDEIVVPATTSFQQAGAMDSEPATILAPSLPNAAAAGASSPQGSLIPAPRVEFELSLQALDYNTRRHERAVEQREFVGSAPFLEMHLRPGTRPEPDSSADVMEILMSPHPPPKATPWLDAARGFPPTPAELGQLSRLDFGTIGFAYSDSGAAATAPAPQAAVLTEEAVESETPVEVAHVEAAPIEPAPPELVTKALPVTLHGLAAPRGKFAETFTSAVLPASDVQIPPSAVLPLRPAIIFAPRSAPAPAAPVPPKAPTAAASAPAATPQPKPEQPKPAPPKPVQERPEARGKTSVVPAPKPAPIRPAPAEVPALRPQAAKVAAPVAPPVAPPVVEAPRTPEPQFSRAMAASASASPGSVSEDSLPSLRMEGTESAWSKLSQGVKIGVAAGVIVALTGIGYLVTRGSEKPASAPVAAAPSAAVASGVPISGGWIEDWGTGGRSSRRISMLSGSVKLSDYRMAFQAQIETKAIGWVFRGLNARNYYVAKVETIKAGLNPTVALVHFAVVDGQDENRVVTPLPMKVRVDTTYKIRFEATGNHFTTWIQDQKIDEWTDNRFGAGGIGLFSERGEHAAMQGNVDVVALVPRN